MNDFRIYSLQEFSLLGITKQGHALCEAKNLGTKVLIKKKDFNLFLQGNLIEGKPVLWKQGEEGICLFKTLQF
jgi:hypothetical protein